MGGASGGDQGEYIRGRLSHYYSWLINKEFAVRTAEQYVAVIKASCDNPVAYMQQQQSRGMWTHAYAAYKLFWEMEGVPDTIDEFRGLKPPRKRPKAVRVLPDELSWRDIATRMWQVPGPLGAIAYLVAMSGLRIGDVCHMTYQNIQDLHFNGRAAIRQKGHGDRQRLYVVGQYPKQAVDRLATERGYDTLGQLLSPSHKYACQCVRNAMGVGCHTFRHLIISHLVRRGEKLSTIAAISGHDNLNTLQIYIDKIVGVDERDVIRAQNELGAELARLPAKPK